MISVIIPVYNSEKRLRYCLDSIIQQTYTNLEILLIDDGSTDRSGEICEQYCHDDTRFKHIVQPNRGVAEARNNGLKAASGDYVAFIDSDDIIHNRYFEYLHLAINEGDYAISTVLYKEVEDCVEIDIASDIPYETAIVSNDVLLDDLYRSMRVGEIDGKPLGVVWGKLYRREFIQDVFFKKLTISSDIEYSVRICWKAGTTVTVPHKMYWWVYHVDSLSHTTHKNGKNMGGVILHSMMDLWFYILENTPVFRADYRGFCLEMLFRRILYAEYTGDKRMKDLREKTICYKKLYMSEFLRNRYIPLKRKMGIWLFCHIPGLYGFTRKRLEVWAGN